MHFCEDVAAGCRKVSLAALPIPLCSAGNAEGLKEDSMKKFDSDKVRDPVCQMLVTQDQHAITYQGMDFAFCSQQCQERFLANPHLYIGFPGEQAPKQAGREVIKRRRLSLEAPLPAPVAQQVVEHLLAMMGVYAVDINTDGLTITYDLLQVTAEQIEETLQQMGAALGEGWGEKLRRAFVHYLEETEVANLEVRSGTGHQHGGPHRHR